MQIELALFDLDTVAILDAEPPREVFGMSRAFARLRARRVLSAVCTSRSRREAHDALRALGWLGDRLDACITADDAARGAPFPDMVERAMRELDVRDPRRVVKVSASAEGIVQGASAGCRCLVGVAAPQERDARFADAPCTQIVPTPALVPELVAKVERLAARARSRAARGLWCS
jgi:phosphoglycolate phosphatase